MNVILFGATGMVRQGALRECLLDPGVERVLSVGRNPIGWQHPKLRECLQTDLYDLSPFEKQLQGYDACFFCLGVSSVGMSEQAYRHITFDLTLSVAQTLAGHNREMTFIHVSGAGTDRSERGRRMWARVKGATENALFRLPFKAAYMFRHGAIVPLHGITSQTQIYQIASTIDEAVLASAACSLPRGDQHDRTSRAGNAARRAQGSAESDSGKRRHQCTAVGLSN
jgi:hypothetical protein